MKPPKNLGALLLAVWLILYGLLTAPFLKFDYDPYSVILPDGRIVYVQDAYTTTSRYPYSQLGSHDRLPDNSGLKNVGDIFLSDSAGSYICCCPGWIQRGCTVAIPDRLKGF